MHLKQIGIATAVAMLALLLGACMCARGDEGVCG